MAHENQVLDNRDATLRKFVIHAQNSRLRKAIAIWRQTNYNNVRDDRIQAQEDLRQSNNNNKQVINTLTTRKQDKAINIMRK